MPTGTLVKSTIRSARSARPISSRLPLVGGEVHRRGQEAALVADLPDLDAGDVAEVEDQEARLAAVEEPQPVAALLDRLERPGVAVDHDHVAEELRVPDRRELAVRDVGRARCRRRTPGCPGRTASRRSLNDAVLDRDRDLVVGLVRRELVAFVGRGAGQHGRRCRCGCPGPPCRPRARHGPGRSPPGPAYTLSRVMPSAWSWYQQRRLALVVRVLEGGEARAPADAELRGRLAREEVVPRALGGVAGRDVARPPAGTRPRRSRRSRRRPRPRRAGGSRSAPGRCTRPGVRVERRPRVAPAGRRPGGLAQCRVGSTGSRCGR